MFWGMQDFDFCPNLIKFYQIYSNLSKFAQILLKLAKILPKLSKNLLGDATRHPQLLHHWIKT